MEEFLTIDGVKRRLNAVMKKGPASKYIDEDGLIKAIIAVVHENSWSLKNLFIKYDELESLKTIVKNKGLSWREVLRRAMDITTPNFSSEKPALFQKTWSDFAVKYTKTFSQQKDRNEELYIPRTHFVDLICTVIVKLLQGIFGLNNREKLNELLPHCVVKIYESICDVDALWKNPLWVDQEDLARFPKCGNASELRIDFAIAGSSHDDQDNLAVRERDDEEKSYSRLPELIANLVAENQILDEQIAKHRQRIRELSEIRAKNLELIEKYENEEMGRIVREELGGYRQFKKTLKLLKKLSELTEEPNVLDCLEKIISQVAKSQTSRQRSDELQRQNNDESEEKEDDDEINFEKGSAEEKRKTREERPQDEELKKGIKKMKKFKKVL